MAELVEGTPLLRKQRGSGDGGSREDKATVSMGTRAQSKELSGARTWAAAARRAAINEGLPAAARSSAFVGGYIVQGGGKAIGQEEKV